MKLMSLEYHKQRLIEKKSKTSLNAKKLESKLLVELKDKLDTYLSDNDRVMLEVHPNVIGEFLDILDDTLLTMYEFEQVDKTKFIFYNKEIDF